MAPKQPVDTVTALANSILLLLLARLAMVALVPLASILVYIGGLYLEARFEQSHVAVLAVAVRLDAVELDQKMFALTINELKSQQALVNQSAQLTSIAWTAWQNTTNARLDKMSDTLMGLGLTVASLDSNVKLLRPAQ